jgi:hypothetical protein
MKQCRAWLLTINLEKKNDRKEVLKVERSLKAKAENYNWFCFRGFKGQKKERNHFHIAFYSDSPIRFDTIKKAYPRAHIEFKSKASTYEQVREYTLKDGAHEGKEEPITEPFEQGLLPKDEQGKRNDLEEAKNIALTGATESEALEKCPSVIARYSQFYGKLRNSFLSKKYGESMRKNLMCFYVFGPTGTGKTFSIYDTYGYKNCYVVSDYKHPFDNYDGQDVLVFDEFYSENLEINTMLKVLDPYPVQLPARYSNKIACFTKVFVISNLKLEDQYRFSQAQLAFYDRFAMSIEFRNRDDEPLIWLNKGFYERRKVCPLAYSSPLKRVSSSSIIELMDLRKMYDNLPFERV